jgi:hypothetical protein
MLTPIGYPFFGDTGAAYAANAVDFQNGNTYLQADPASSPVTSNKNLTFSIWSDRAINSSSSKAINLYETGGLDNVVQMDAHVSPLGQVRFRAWNAAGTVILNVDTDAAVFDSNWHHILISVDLSNSSKRHFYVDDVAEAVTWGTYTNDDIDWGGVDQINIGSNVSGALPWDGCMAELYLNNTYLDLSVEANRRQFITASGTPAARDANGGWMGSGQPYIWMSGATGTWNTNKGTNGDTFTEFGTGLATCAGLPVKV